MKYVLILLTGLLVSIGGYAASINVKTYIPVKAATYLPVVVAEQKRVMPESPSTAYFGGLIEQESCISLTHKRCWDPTSELKTAREQGIGLGMITRAYRTDGSVRFDALQEMKVNYNDQLKELSWLTIKTRPDLQIRTMMLMTRDNYKRLWMVKEPLPRLQMADAAYNGGAGGLEKERVVCGLTKGCDPQQWFGHIEKQCLKSKKPLYGNRNACDINREHVALIFRDRMAKYQQYLSLP